MSTVTALPGVTPTYKKTDVNEEAIEFLKKLLADFESGRFTMLGAVVAGPNDNDEKISVRTCGDAIRLVGLSEILKRRLIDGLFEE